MTQSATVDGRAMAYVSDGQGEGPALILLHFFGGSSRSWRGVMARLAPERRCIAVDLPGFGASDPLEPRCTVDRQAEAVEALLDGLGVDERVLVGHSMGGKIATAMALRRPGEVRQLILVAPSPPGPEPGDPSQRARLIAHRGERAAMEALLASLVGRRLAPELHIQTVDDHLKTAPMAWSWWLEHGVDEDLTPRLAGWSTPTVVLSGADDPVLSVEVHAETARLLGGAERRSVADAGHLLPLEAPDETAALIRAALV